MEFLKEQTITYDIKKNIENKNKNEIVKYFMMNKQNKKFMKQALNQIIKDEKYTKLTYFEQMKMDFYWKKMNRKFDSKNNIQALNIFGQEFKTRWSDYICADRTRQATKILNYTLDEYAHKCIEDLLIFMINLARSRNYGDIIMAIMCFIKMIMGEDPLLAPKTIMNSIDKIQNIVERIIDFYNDYFGNNLPIQDGGLNVARTMLDNYSMAKKSPLFEKFYSFYMYSISLGIFSKIGLNMDTLGYTKIQQEMVKCKYWMGPDFVVSTIDTLVFLCERGAQCIQTGSMSAIFHSGKDYEQWFTEARDKILNSKFLADPEANNICLYKYFGELKHLIEKGEAILIKAKSLGDTEVHMVTKLLTELKYIDMTENTRKSAQSLRKPPFSFIIYGDTSVAKTTFSWLLARHNQKYKKLPEGDEYIHVRVFAEEYMTNFATHQHTMIYDDAAAQSPALGVMDKSLGELIQIVNYTAYNPPQAHLDNKGKTPVKIDCMIITTNTKLLNTYAYFSHPVAVNRRFPHIITITPKEEYKCEFNTEQIDPKKLPELEDGEYPNFWNIRVDKIKALGNRATTSMEHEFTDIYEFLKWFNEARDTFDNNQAKAMRANEKIKTVILCQLCGIPQNHCSCQLPVQSGEDRCSLCFMIGPFCTCNMTQHYDFFLNDEKIAVYDSFRNRVFVKNNLDLERLHNLYVKGVRNVRECTDSDIRKFAEYNVKDNIHEHMILYNINKSLARETAKMKVKGIDYVDESDFGHAEETFWDKFRTKFLIWLFSLTITFPWTRRFFLYFVKSSILKTLIRYDYWCHYYFGDRVQKGIFYLIGDKIHTKTGKIKFLLKLAVIIGGSIAFFKLAQKLFTYYYKDNRLNEEICKPALTEKEENKTHKQLIKQVKQSVVDNANQEFIETEISHLISLSEKQKMMNEDKKILQTNSISKEIGVIPKPREKERENVWYKENFEITTLDYSSQTTSTLNSQNFVSNLNQHIVALRIFYINENNIECTKLTGGIIIKSRVVLANNHAFPKEGMFKIQVIIDNKNGIGQNIEINVTNYDIKRYPERDVALFLVRAMPVKKDIIKYFMEDTYNGKINGVYLKRSMDGHILKNHLKNIGMIKEYLNFTLNYEGPAWFSTAEVPTQNGDCGSLLVMDTPIGFILGGFHTFGDGTDTRVGAIILTKQFLNKAITHAFPDEFLIQDGTPQLSTPSISRGLVELNEKSVFRYIPEGVAQIFGSFNDGRARPKSRVRNTILSEKLKNFGYQIKYGAPAMKGYKIWRNAALDMVNPIVNFNNETLDMVKQAFLDEILEHLPSSELNEIKIYDNQTTINGMPGLQFVDKINRNTSMGCPWKKSKRWYIEMETEINRTNAGHENDIIFKDEVMDRVDNILLAYFQGKRAMPVYCGNAKDEATKFKKIEEEATRIFMGSPIDQVIVVRKYLLSVIRVIQRNRFIFESMPGTVAQSLEWEEIYEHLTQFGLDTLFAGDYKKFDKRMPPAFILAAFWIIMKLCAAAGYDKNSQQVVMGIAEDTAFPMCDFWGDLIMFFCSNPSGHPLTVIINGIVNSLYVRYATVLILISDGKNMTYIKIYIRNFKMFIIFITYGDDNAGNSRDKRINHTTLQAALAIMGITYTMADKDRESVPYIHIDEVSFLKRSWRYDEDVGATLCPLDHDSIEKMLMVCVSSKSVSHEHQCVDILETATREYFFYGKKIFNEKRELLMEVAKQCELDKYIKPSTFPDWETLKLGFWVASKHTKLYAERCNILN